ncbi:uncharacterized protein K460DRAFT_411095 [Cucurbitaria berberidis CBS 394.84]|uniref:Uncharacterized protein n=1 Tax=Cucurbitaria berberidis CBS 394.84 TaxID=1168544 RepID=A0A9P4G7K9_9PLEO|nr:uncharacterized protein K460DRAFT_411095 [Cucurbitaria berberidis CBS 394.84]KAF1840512.1 hypothetical protein K460DRAFT_411095 [Cucurbitaria berberidis CBS 394.84]
MATQEQTPRENTMRLAEMLSDLVSLRACDPSAALALVSARPSTSHQDANTTIPSEEEDVDLKRAKDLLKLHYEVKEAHKRGQLSNGLDEARRAVEKAVGG